MAIALSKIENPQDMEVFVNGPRGANRMFIYTGTAVFNFRGNSERRWKRDTLSFKVGRKFEPGQIVRIVATASLASVFNDGSWHDGGWAVDLVDADLDDNYFLIEKKNDERKRIIRYPWDVLLFANSQIYLYLNSRTFP
jgi:hypothetical protein